MHFYRELELEFWGTRSIEN